MDKNTEKIDFPSDEITTELIEFGSKEILQDFSRIYEKRLFCDVTFVFTDGNESRAHKAILAARSPVFAAMFTHQSTSESLQGRVEISDASAEVFEHFLAYIYTGQAPSMDQLAEKLLPLSDKVFHYTIIRYYNFYLSIQYQVDSLKALCENTLCSKLSPNLVTEYLVLADTHNAAKLKAKAFEYFQMYVYI